MLKTGIGHKTFRVFSRINVTSSALSSHSSLPYTPDIFTQTLSDHFESWMTVLKWKAIENYAYRVPININISGLKTYCE